MQQKELTEMIGTKKGCFSNDWRLFACFSQALETGWKPVLHFRVTRASSP